MSYNKILISNRAGIGDTVLTTPVLKALREKFPESKLTFMISDNALPIVEGLPFVDEIITYNKKQNNLFGSVRRIWRYDLALCLDPLYRTAAMAFLACIPIRAGIGHKRGKLLSNPIDRDPCYEMTYESSNYVNIIKNSTGITLEGDLTRLYIGPMAEADELHVDNLLRKHAVNSPRGLITISPFTAWAPKDWPIEYYNELIKRLKIQNPSCEVLLVGRQEDAAKASPIVGAVNLLGKTTLKQMAEIIRRSCLFIGGCSASIHIAAAVDTPIVGIYGPTSPQRWAPVKNSIIVSQRETCCPCYRRASSCEQATCIKEITVDKVYEACRQQLAR